MSDTYLDSSFLLKLYFNEPESYAVDTQLRMITGDTIVTKLTDVEVVSSVHRRLSPQDGILAARTYLQNRAAGVFSERAIDVRVFERATRIADRMQEHIS